MRRTVIPAALSALLLASLFVPPSGAADRGKSTARSPLPPQKAGYQARGEFVPGEVLVKFRTGVTRAVERATHNAMGARVLNRIAGGLGIDHIRLPRGLTVADAVRRYSANPLVEYAEPNFYRYPSVTPNDTSYTSMWGLNNTAQSHPIADPPPPTAAGTADADIDFEEAWNIEQGDPSVVVAVLDSGVDVAHGDLAGNIWQNPLEFGGTPLFDDDGNGYDDDVNGRDTAEDDNTLLEPNPAFAGYDHGTHVAGTIAAVTHNASGVSGICGGDGTANSGCKIMVLKFMEPIDTDGDFVPDAMAGALDAELEAIAYARTEGAHIINGSFGGPSWTNSEREAFRLAGVQGDILFVAAAANDSLDNDMPLGLSPNGPFSPAYPASYNLSNILTVAASNHNDEYGYFTGCETDPTLNKPDCAFTNFGRFSVDVAAPGVDVLSTTPGNTYATFDGTSMATPHVAGVAGLVQAYDRFLNAGTDTLSPVDIKNMIMNSVDTTDSLGAPLDLNNSMNTVLFSNPDIKKIGKFTRTAGRVNALDALTGATTNASPNHDGDIPGAAGMSRSKVTGSLAWPGDVNDIRKKRLTRGKTYRLTLVVPSGRDYDLYLVKADAKEVWQPGKLIKGAAHGGATDETFTFKPGSTKTYFIHLSTWFTNGSYTLKVVCIKNC